MNYRYALLTAALCVSGVVHAELPAHEVVSTAQDREYRGHDGYWSFVAYPDDMRAHSTAEPGATAAVLDDGLVASARTEYGHNRAFVRVDRAGSEPAEAGTRSAWYERMTITGGTGSGTARFEVRLRGVIDAGRDAGRLYYGLAASPQHPRAYQNVIGAAPGAGWMANASGATSIVEYRLLTSPYDDTSRMAHYYAPYSLPPPTGGEYGGIPTVQDGRNPPQTQDPGMGLSFDPADPDRVLAPGAGQVIDLLLTGTFSFTYGEAFYLVGEFGVSILDGSPCAPDDAACTDPGPDIDLATMLDFGDGAFLSSILLPDGATASFASGTPYNVATVPVPEPGEWALLLAGLGLVGWRARRVGGTSG